MIGVVLIPLALLLLVIVVISIVPAGKKKADGEISVDYLVADNAPYNEESKKKRSCIYT